MTRWLDVPGWEGRYRVSDTGEVRSYDRECATGHGGVALRRGRVLTPVRKSGRYLAVTLAEGARREQIFLHDIVLAAFVGPKPEGKVTCHADDDKDNNRLTNLRYGTHLENMSDAVRNGRRTKGEKHHRAKLTEQQAKKIKRSRKPAAELAELYPVSASHIWSIQSGRTWKHL